MESDHNNDEILSKLPARFYERVIREIPAATWVRVLNSDPIVKSRVLEGFSLQPGKFSGTIHKPPVMNRLLRETQTNRPFFEKILAEWKEEQSDTISYLAMLDPDVVSANLSKMRDLMGPSRLCMGLYALGLLGTKRAADAVTKEDFWTESPDASIFELLVPTLSVWGEFIENHPGLSEEFLESQEGSGFLFDIEEGQAEQKTRHHPELREPFKKVEKKLRKAQTDLAKAGKQLNSLRVENEDLRRKIREYEAEFEKKLNDSISRIRTQWFERYGYFDRDETVKETERLESLLQRTRRALELQKRADEEYGLISDIRAKLFEIDLSLNNIEAVYAGSMVVHKEVEKVKEALLMEKNRLLKLPDIRKILGYHHDRGDEILAGINLLDPLPASLPKLDRLSKMLPTLSEIGLVKDLARVEEAVRHKKRQMMELLYAQFDPSGKERSPEPRFLEDFVGSGRSRRYDLFIDGYNVLLRVSGGDENTSRIGFTQFREQFIEAVTAKSKHFAGIYLVFDGVEDSKDIHGNCEIIYTDKTRSSADAVIIEMIVAGRNKKVLLVTGDEGIISAVQDKVFALLSVVDFYMFLFD